MTGGAAGAIAYGAALGALSGWGSRLALKKVLNSPDNKFYLVFTAGFFVRLAVLIAAVCMLRHEKGILIISFTGSFILVQMIFEAVRWP